MCVSWSEALSHSRSSVFSLGSKGPYLHLWFSPGVTDNPSGSRSYEGLAGTEDKERIEFLRVEACVFRFGWTRTWDSCLELLTLPLAVPRWQTYSMHYDGDKSVLHLGNRGLNNHLEEWRPGAWLAGTSSLAPTAGRWGVEGVGWALAEALGPG